MSQQTNSAQGVLTTRTAEPDGIAVVTVSGEIDSMAEDSPFTELLDVMREDLEGLVVDMDAVTFFGSAGVHVLIAMEEGARHRNIPFAVVASTRAVRMPLSVTGVDALLALHPDVVGALAAVRCLPHPRRG
ncbi:STAS domain-containing protein [Lentzea sp. NPDC058450]|uniref:STAS domain-containing protein n=1 Tax=Lentzea sp. NPDC058450 TaxID=3346505 RepID=UPI00364C1FD5